jgi:hypothetical protein
VIDPFVSGQIHRHVQGIAPERSNLILNRFKLGVGSGSQNDPAAGPGQHQRNGSADASPCSRDNPNLSLKIASRSIQYCA